MKRTIAVCAGLGLWLGGAGVVSAQEKPVSREEFLKLQRENEQLRKEMEEMRAWKTQMDQKAAVAPGSPGSAIKDGDDARAMAKYTFPGSTEFLLTGYGSAGFSSFNDRDAAFTAQFNPTFLWRINDRLLFEGEMEMELEGGETHTALELANLSYVLNDYMTFQAGKFLNPMNAFVERYHMAWVNRLPDKPLAVYDGLLPETYVGANVRGGLPLASTRVNYSAFIANAPNLITSVSSPDDVASLGTLDFDNFDNVGGRMAVGGHVGFLPIPELELGYGAQYSGTGGSDESAWLQSVDLAYLRDWEAIRGSVRVNAQWVWSKLGKGTYDNNGLPVVFRNNRDGGYAQIAYRPTKLDSAFLKRLEGVFRFDMLNQKGTPDGVDESRYTVGLNYWLTSKSVFKVAYQIDQKSPHTETENNGILVQFATGF